MAAVKPGYEIDRDEDGFTRQQREVRKLRNQGLKAVEIAETLGVTRARVYQLLTAVREIEKELPYG